MLSKNYTVSMIYDIIPGQALVVMSIGVFFEELKKKRTRHRRMGRGGRGLEPPKILAKPIFKKVCMCVCVLFFFSKRNIFYFILNSARKSQLNSHETVVS